MYCIIITSHSVTLSVANWQLMHTAIIFCSINFFIQSLPENFRREVYGFDLDHSSSSPNFPPRPQELFTSLVSLSGLRNERRTGLRTASIT